MRGESIWKKGTYALSLLIVWPFQIHWIYYKNTPCCHWMSSVLHDGRARTRRKRWRQLSGRGRRLCAARWRGRGPRPPTWKTDRGFAWSWNFWAWQAWRRKTWNEPGGGKKMKSRQSSGHFLKDAETVECSWRERLCSPPRGLSYTT